MAGKRGTGYREYPISLAQEVRQMHDGGWTLTQIQRVLAERGEAIPSITTLKRWTNPARRAHEMREHRRRQAERAAATSHFRWPGARSPEWMVGRMLFLTSIGISCEDVAKVMNADFGLSLTRNQVRGVVTDRSMPRELRRMQHRREAVAA